MKINWDMKIYNGMSKETQKLCNDSKNWLLKHKDLSSKYINSIDERHPALWFSEVMTNIEKGIDNKEMSAVSLGCLYVINAQKAPFGKTHKSNVLARLKRNKEMIDQQYVSKFKETLSRLSQMRYPPRETKNLEKLIKIIC